MAAADQHSENTRMAFLEEHTRMHKISGSKNGVSLKCGFLKRHPAPNPPEDPASLW
jgi:hypothetical protein